MTASHHDLDEMPRLVLLHNLNVTWLLTGGRLVATKIIHKYVC